MKKVVVLGADGFLGYNLTRRLYEQGYDVLAIVYKGTESKIHGSIPNVRVKEFTFDSLDEITIQGYDTLYHMAWAGVNSSMKNNAQVQATNVIYGLKVIDFAKNNLISRVIIPGSAAEVSCGASTITGNEPPSPSDIYSASKVATRYLCQTYANQLGIGIIWTLITSIYGPGRNDNNLITYTVRSLLKGEKPSFTGLEQRWDFLYVDDLIEALSAIGENGIIGKIYPVGSGHNRQMKEYVEYIRNSINPNLPLGIGEQPYKSSIIDNQILDISELINDTGFSPKVSFETGIKKVIDYYKSTL